jgi:hypothetical protein
MLAKNSGSKDAMRECRRAERFFGKSAKNAEPWALRLYDHVCVRLGLFTEAFQKADAEQTGKIARDEFIETVQCMCVVMPEDVDLERVASANEKEKMIDYKEFLLGRKYINKQYLVSAYEGKKKKKAGGRGGRGRAGKTKILMPICTRNEGPRSEDGGPPTIYVTKQLHITDLTRFDRDSRPRHAIEDDSHWYLTRPERPRVHIRDLIRERDINTLRSELDLAAPSGEQTMPTWFDPDNNVDIVDRFYKTPLMVACAKGDIDLVKMLVSSG